MKFRIAESRTEHPVRIWPVGVAIVLGTVLSIFWLGRYAKDLSPASDETTDNSAYVDSTAQAIDRLSAFTLEQASLTFDDKRTATGLKELAAVLDHVARREKLGSSIYASLADEIRADADRLQREPTSTGRATIARASFVSAAEAVSVWQRRSYAHLERAAARLLDAARSLDADRPLLEQKAQVQEFFEGASDTLRGMAGVQM